MQQPEIITIAFFPSEPQALGQVDEDSFGERLQHVVYAFWSPCISNSLKKPLCFEDYDSTKFRPAHGNVDSSTKLVLRFNEIPAGSWKRRLQYYTCTTI